MFTNTVEYTLSVRTDQHLSSNEAYFQMFKDSITSLFVCNLIAVTPTLEVENGNPR